MHKNKVRVAFTLFGDGSWTGGINYLKNLFSAISELPNCKIEPVLFVSPNANPKVYESLVNYLPSAPIIVKEWDSTIQNRAFRFISKYFLQKDGVSFSLFKSLNIDVVFHNDEWFGLRFPISSLVWIPDFQHKHLPAMFSTAKRLKRDISFRALSSVAKKIMLSSNDSSTDCKKFFPKHYKKVCVVPFAVHLENSILDSAAISLLDDYPEVPSNYFYCPGQLWKHKNHTLLVEALCSLKKNGIKPVVILTGNPSDSRNPNYPNELLDLVKSKGIEENFIFLGMVPYEYIMPLMRRSIAVINPSLFEGWSTTVEEAKALGVPMLLSDLNVHREQAPKKCLFFDPSNSTELANALSKAWKAWLPGPRLTEEKEAFIEYKDARRSFALNFEQLVMDVFETTP